MVCTSKQELELSATFDSNREYNEQPNNRIGIGGKFLSILDLEFQSNSITDPNSVHPNTVYVYIFAETPHELLSKKLFFCKAVKIVLQFLF